MEGMRFTRNRQNTRSQFWEIFGGKSYAAARAGRGWVSVDLKHVGAFIPCTSVIPEPE